MNEILARLRAAGWMVAVHNDYTLRGRRWTFWLFTHPLGVWVKGEGRNDANALVNAENMAEARLANLLLSVQPSQTQQAGVTEVRVLKATKAAAFAGRSPHDCSRDAEHFWQNTAEDTRDRYLVMIRAALSAQQGEGKP
jgi:hypothetical protein